MAGDIEIEIPIKVGGSSSDPGAMGDKMAAAFMKRVESQIKNLGIGGNKGGGVATAAGVTEGGLTKSLTKVAASVGIIALILESTEFLIKPVFTILKAILIVIFSVFLPILKPLLSILMISLKGWMSLAPILSNFIGTALKVIGAIIAAPFKFIYDLFKGLWDALIKGWELLVGFGTWVWENVLKPGWEWLKGVGKMIWNDYLKPAWDWLIGIGQKIWDTVLLPAWNWFKDIGSKIWDGILVPAWQALAKSISGAWSWFKGLFTGGSKTGSTTKVNDMILRPNGQVIQTSPSDTIFATKNPGNIGGNNKSPIVINFNNPVVREEKDFKKLVEQISIAIQRDYTRRKTA